VIFALLNNDLVPKLSSALFLSVPRNLRVLKVEMIVVAAPRIELCLASRTARITLHVLKNSYRCAAGAAKNCLVIPFTFWPGFKWMTGERLVTIFAGIVQAATFHLDSDDVFRPMIMLATGL
jgi:hypothetical protein